MAEENAGLKQPQNVGLKPKFLHKIIHDNNASRNQKSMTRDNMGQRPGGKNYKFNNTTGNLSSFIDLLDVVKPRYCFGTFRWIF